MKTNSFFKKRFLPLLLSALIIATFSIGFSVSVTAANSGNSTVVFFSGDEQVTKAEYSTFEQAFAAASAYAGSGNRSEITLGGDCVLDQMLELNSSSHVSLDLNGHCIRRNLKGDQEKKGGLFIVKNSAELTVKDSNPKSAGYDGVKGGVLADGASSDTGGCFHITEKGSVIMESGTVYNCTTDEHGGCAYVSDGSFTMTGGRIYFCKTTDSADNCHGGAVYLNEGTVKLSDCKIDNCYSEDDGGAIFSQGGKIYLTNVILSGNKCRNYGGAICLWDDTLLEARSCTFVNSYTEEDGGAVYVDDAPDDNGAILFESCAFRNNTAEEDGGAIYICDDGVALSNTEITGNHAKERGGGVFVDGRYSITLRGLVTIKNNTCDKPSMANLTLEDGKTSDAKVMSAGLYKGSYIGIGTTAGSGTTYLTNSEFSEYQARYFYPDEGKIEFKGTSVRYSLMTTSASIFGNGYFWSILILGMTGIIIAIAVIVAKKRKDKKVLVQGTDNSAEGGAQHDQNN